jgi:hypothetical protein
MSMSHTCATCRWWIEKADPAWGYCKFPVPLWLIQTARSAGYYSPMSMRGDETDCLTHQPKGDDA